MLTIDGDYVQTVTLSQDLLSTVDLEMNQSISSKKSQAGKGDRQVMRQ